jgi:hypothetical protein
MEMFFMIIESIIGLSVLGLVVFLFLKNSQDKKITSTNIPSKVVAETVYATVEPGSVTTTVEVKAPLVEQVEEPATVETPPEKPKRARNKGKLVGDNTATPDVNEAWVGGKAPAKNPKPTKKPKMTVVKK